MGRQIDVLHRRFDAANRSLADGFWRSHDGDHGAIMIRIHLVSEKVNVGNRSHRVYDCIDNVDSAAFTEIGNTLNKWSHVIDRPHCSGGDIAPRHWTQT